jgi:hypothetical protein
MLESRDGTMKLSLAVVVDMPATTPQRSPQRFRETTMRFVPTIRLPSGTDSLGFELK